MIAELITYLNTDPQAALIAIAALLIGLTGGIGIAVCLILLDQPTLPSQRKTRKIKTKRRQPAHSARRAALQAVMMVETGAFSGPYRS